MEMAVRCMGKRPILINLFCVEWVSPMIEKPDFWAGHKRFHPQPPNGSPARITPDSLAFLRPLFPLKEIMHPKSRTRLSDFTFTLLHWRRKWQPTPVFLPGESQGWEPGGLPFMGSHRVGHERSDLAAAAAAANM